MSKGNLLLKDGKGAIDITQADLVLRLVEMLLAEKDKNINQSNAEKDQKYED